MLKLFTSDYFENVTSLQFWASQNSSHESSSIFRGYAYRKLEFEHVWNVLRHSLGKWCLGCAKTGGELVDLWCWGKIQHTPLLWYIHCCEKKTRVPQFWPHYTSVSCNATYTLLPQNCRRACTLLKPVYGSFSTEPYTQTSASSCILPHANQMYLVAVQLSWRHLRACILFPKLFQLAQAICESLWQWWLGSVKLQLLLQLLSAWSHPASFKLLLPAGQEERMKHNPTVLWKAFINVSGVTSSRLILVFLPCCPEICLLTWMRSRAWKDDINFFFLCKAATALQKRNTSAPLAFTGRIFISCMLP